MEKNTNLLYPPLKWHVKDEGKLVFLAGPIQGAEDWQSKASEILHKGNPDLLIANPRVDKYPSPEELQETLGVTDEWILQVSWETAHLRTASKTGAIMFWLAKEAEHFCERAFGQTTRFELAEWFTHYKYRKVNQPDNPLKVIVGIDHDFPGAKYIIHRIFDDCPEFKVGNSLEATCELTLEALSS